MIRFVMFIKKRKFKYQGDILIEINCFKKYYSKKKYIYLLRNLFIVIRTLYIIVVDFSSRKGTNMLLYCRILTGNQLTAIEDGVFSHLPSLKVL
jgi:hypothetical protein